MFTTFVAAHAPDTLWTKTYGGFSYDRCFSTVQPTGDGGYIIGADTESFGMGLEDIWIIKTDSLGDTLWTRLYGGIYRDACRAIQQTDDSGYMLVGGTQSFGSGSINMFLMKTDSLGDSLWFKIFDNAHGYTGQQTFDGGFIIGGSYFRSSQNFYFIKTDAVGDTIWTKEYGGWGEDIIKSIQQTVDSGYIITGRTESYGAGDDDIWLIKTDKHGDSLWSKTYGGSSWDYSSYVNCTSDGGYVITGRTNSFCVGGSDVWLLKTNASGDTLWTRTFGGTGTEGGRYVQETSDGGFVIVGFTNSYGAGGYDAWIIKTNANGDSLWTQTYGGLYFDACYGGLQLIDNSYIFSGHTQSWGVGLSDVWLVKTEPDTLGINEMISIPKTLYLIAPTILSDISVLQANNQIFDITGRLVNRDEIKSGIYFLFNDSYFVQKIIILK